MQKLVEIVEQLKQEKQSLNIKEFKLDTEKTLN
jgi:hypothetical protein